MLKTRVIPCLLLDDEALVKTVKFKNPSYVGDPVNAIKIYNEKEVDELILLDISATRLNREIPFKVLSEVATECFMPLAYGGGVKTIADMKKIFGLGVEKIALNTEALKNPALIQEAASLFGSQSVIVSIDVKKNLWGNYEVYAHAEKKGLKLDPVAHAKAMEKAGAGELLVTSVDREGTWSGFDVELVKKITSNVSIPVIACGGAANIDDIGKVVNEGGASAVALGSMVVYQGKDLGVLINFPSRKEIESVVE